MSVERKYWVIETPDMFIPREKMIVLMSEKEIVAARIEFPGLIIRLPDNAEEILEYVGPDQLGRAKVNTVDKTKLIHQSGMDIGGTLDSENLENLEDLTDLDELKN